MKRVLVCGAGGFIGAHLVKRLRAEGCWVRGVDLKQPKYSESLANEFVVGDLTNEALCRQVIDEPFDEVYQLAADMGGAGYVFTGDNDFNVMHNSALVNLNVVKRSSDVGVKRIFYSSSACIYPEYNQLDCDNPKCAEDTAYPAQPDSEYGWEKLFSERFYLAASRTKGIEVRVARYHNIFGPEGSWNDGREKAPPAICRKVAEADDRGAIEIWGDGLQTRSFLYIDECVEGTIRLMRSSFAGPVNIGSDRMVSIRALVDMIASIGGKELRVKTVPGPTGVRGRNSDNRMIFEKLGWRPSSDLEGGLRITYEWIKNQVEEITP